MVADAPAVAGCPSRLHVSIPTGIPPHHRAQGNPFFGKPGTRYRVDVHLGSFEYVLKYHVKRPAIHHQHDEGAQLARLALLTNVADGALWTILPIHLAALAGSDEPVGYYFAILAVVGIVASVASAALFTRTRRLFVAVGSLTVLIVFSALLVFATGLVVFGAIDLIRSIAFLMLTITVGLLVRDHATLADLAVQEGRFYLFSNVGWFVGPLLAGYVASEISREAVFGIIAAIHIASLLYLWTMHLSDHRPLASQAPVENSRELFDLLIEFVKRPRLRRVFKLALGLEVWWVISSIYVPLAVIDLGYGHETVGWVVAGGVVPLLTMESWVGKQASRNGIRRYIVSGFGFLAVLAASFPLLDRLPWLLLFGYAIVNVGAALVEPLTDTYFFEVADESEEDRYFGIYNASAPIAGFVGPLLAGIAFTIGFGLNGVWLITALYLAWVATSALKISPEM